MCNISIFTNDIDLELYDNLHRYHIYHETFPHKYSISYFSYDSCCSSVSYFILFLFKINYFPCMFFKNSQYFFMRSSPLCTSCLFFMALNDDIADNENPDGISSLTFVVGIFQGYFYTRPFFLKICNLHK